MADVRLKLFNKMPFGCIQMLYKFAHQNNDSPGFHVLHAFKISFPKFSFKAVIKQDQIWHEDNERRKRKRKKFKTQQSTNS